MADETGSAEQFEPGGSIVLRSEDGQEVHVITPHHLGNLLDAEDLTADILDYLSSGFGDFSTQDGWKPDNPKELTGWWEWEAYSAPAYRLERRSDICNVGASGAVEQIIINLAAAAGYDALKKVVLAVADIVRHRSAEFGLDHADPENIERIEEVLKTRFSLASPLKITPRPPAKAGQRWNVEDRKGVNLEVMINDDGVMFISRRGRSL